MISSKRQAIYETGIRDTRLKGSYQSRSGAIDLSLKRFASQSLRAFASNQNRHESVTRDNSVQILSCKFASDGVNGDDTGKWSVVSKA